MKSLTIRLSEDVADLIERRDGEFRDLSINTLVNVAVRRMLAPEPGGGTPEDDAVMAALRRVIARDARILEALKTLDPDSDRQRKLAKNIMKKRRGALRKLAE